MQTTPPEVLTALTKHSFFEPFSVRSVEALVSQCGGKVVEVVQIILAERVFGESSPKRALLFVKRVCLAKLNGSHSEEDCCLFLGVSVLRDRCLCFPCFLLVVCNGTACMWASPSCWVEFLIARAARKQICEKQTGGRVR